MKPVRWRLYGILAVVALIPACLGSDASSKPQKAAENDSAAVVDLAKDPTPDSEPAVDLAKDPTPAPVVDLAKDPAPGSEPVVDLAKDPQPDPPTDPAQQAEEIPSLTKPFTEEEKDSVLDDFVTPDQIAAKAFQPPPDAKQLSKKNLWVDRKNSRVYCDGYVAMRDGPLEMFACGVGTKEHESIVAVLAAAGEVHAALLAIGAQQGKPVQVLPEYKPATGQRIRVWVTYFDKDGKFQSVDARTWIRKEDNKAMETDWVFGGSQVWTDPEDGVKHYSANSGDMICVSNFTTAMMDVPVESSADAGLLLYRPFSTNIPDPGTPVRLILQPIEEGKPEWVAPDEKVLSKSQPTQE